MTYLSFTRNREDVLIMRALGKIENGFYVDVGAYQPIVDSNTYALYQRGWQGIAVEPQQGLRPLWSQMRPRDILIEQAIGATVGETRLFEFPGRNQNATTDPRIVEMHESEGRAAICTMVTQTSLTLLLEKYRPLGDIHLLSVDVEGAERAVLNGLDMTRFAPWLMVLESTLPNRFEENFREWEPALLEQGYTFAYFDGVNRFYLAPEHQDLQQHFTYPPCVWDDFLDHRLEVARQAARFAQKELEDLKDHRRNLAE